MKLTDPLPLTEEIASYKVQSRTPLTFLAAKTNTAVI